MKKEKISIIIGGIIAAIIFGVLAVQFSSINEDGLSQDNDLPEIVDVDKNNTIIDNSELERLQFKICCCGGRSQMTLAWTCEVQCKPWSASSRIRG